MTSTIILCKSISILLNSVFIIITCMFFLNSFQCCFIPKDTPTGGYMSEDQCSDMSGDQPQSMQTGR